MLTDLQLTFVDAPTAELDPLYDGLTDHARPFVDRPGFQGVGVFARDAEGRLLGGAYGYVNWSWFEVSLLWVAEEQRGCGLGGRLLEALETVGRERGCTQAQVDTFSFQALAFYQRHGYATFAELENYPPGHRRCYLRKEL